MQIYTYLLVTKNGSNRQVMNAFLRWLNLTLRVHMAQRRSTHERFLKCLQGGGANQDMFQILLIFTKAALLALQASIWDVAVWCLIATERLRSLLSMQMIAQVKPCDPQQKEFWVEYVLKM